MLGEWAQQRHPKGHLLLKALALAQRRPSCHCMASQAHGLLRALVYFMLPPFGGPLAAHTTPASHACRRCVRLQLEVLQTRQVFVSLWPPPFTTSSNLYLGQGPQLCYVVPRRLIFRWEEVGRRRHSRGMPFGEQLSGRPSRYFFTPCRRLNVQWWGLIEVSVGGV